MFTVVKHVTGRNPRVMSDREGDVNVESDCEGDLLGVNDESLETKVDGEEPTRAVLTIGSFSAYVPPSTTLSSQEK